MFGYESASEEIQARIETLRNSAEYRRVEATELKEQAARALTAAKEADRIADEYAALASPSI